MTASTHYLPKRHYPGASLGYVPKLGQIRPHRLSRIPLRVVELCGGLATSLETLLRTDYMIRSYTWVDTDPDAHTVAAQRIAHLRHNFPHLLPSEAIQDWDSRLPLDVRTISPELVSATFPKGIDLILASPTELATQVSISHREHTPLGPDIGRHIIRLVLRLSESQPDGLG